MKITPRITNGLLALFCLGLICVALYMQHVMGLVPCYLCVTQRAFIIAIGLVALVAAIHSPNLTGRRVYAALTGLLALAGGFFSSKQLWLQSLPEDKVPACGPPVDYLFDAFKFSEALAMLFRGDGNCAEVQWTLFGLSIPGWTLLCFIAMLLVSLWLGFRKN